jgi:nucleoside-diphosphate-sugar epimerase
VIFESPDPLEEAGYSRATKARLNGDKLRALGWKPMYDLRTGIERTMGILKDVSRS